MSGLNDQTDGPSTQVRPWPYQKILTFLGAHYDLVLTELAARRKTDAILLQEHDVEEVIKKGYILCPLSVEKQEVTDLQHYKMYRITFIRPNQGGAPTFFRPHSLRPGDQVLIQNDKIEWSEYWSSRTPTQMATVSQVRPKEITVTVEKPVFNERERGSAGYDPPRLTRLVKNVNYNTFAVLLATLQAFATANGGSLPSCSEELRGGPGHGAAETSTDGLLSQWTARCPSIAKGMEGLATPLTRALLDPGHFRAHWIKESGGARRSLPPLPLPLFNPNLNEQQIKAIKNGLFLPSVTYVRRSVLLRTIQQPGEQRLLEHSHDNDPPQPDASMPNGSDETTSQPDELFRLRAEVAADHALGQSGAPWLPLHLIHGPPGTGKTSTIVELAMQIVCGVRITQGTGTRAPRVLIAAPTHAAIDSVAERLISPDAPWAKALQDNLFLLAREGNVSKMNPAVAAYEQSRRGLPKKSKGNKSSTDKNGQTKDESSKCTDDLNSKLQKLNINSRGPDPSNNAPPKEDPGPKKSREKEDTKSKKSPEKEETETEVPEKEQTEGSLYRVLGVPPSINQEGLRKAYHRLALRLHPDKSKGNKEEATEKFKIIRNAYETLTNPKLKAEHDRDHLRTPSSTRKDPPKTGPVDTEPQAKYEETQGSESSRPDENNKGPESSNTDPVDAEAQAKPGKSEDKPDDGNKKHESPMSEPQARSVPVIVMSTLHSTSKLTESYDFIIIDEAAQSIEALNWVALLRQHARDEGLTKMVLVGDPKQLPPLVLTGPPGWNDGTRNLNLSGGVPTPPKTLRATLFDRLARTYCPAGLKATTSTTGVCPLTLLATQYRFNESIQAFPNDNMYDSQLRAGERNRWLRLSDLFTEPERDFSIPALAEDFVANWNKRLLGPAVNGRFPHPKDMEREFLMAYQEKMRRSNNPSQSRPVCPDGMDKPLVVYDTSHHEAREGFDRSSNSQSLNNVGELVVALRHVIHLLHRGVRPDRIAIVSPYYGQVSTLREFRLANPANGHLIRVAKYLPTLHISTCDSTQGQEFDVVIFVCVRSNALGNLGFLTDAHRLNVAMTRAKRQLCVVGDLTTLTFSSERRRAFLRRWVAHLRAHAAFLPANTGDSSARAIGL